MCINGRFNSSYGLALLKIKDYENAKDMLKRALKINPTDYSAHANLALVYSNLDEKDLAVEEFEKTFSLNPDLKELKLDYGNVLLSLDKKEEALLAYEDYLKAKPDDVNALYNVGVLFVIFSLTKKFPKSSE